jgi:preprotein translocase subunit YajC
VSPYVLVAVFALIYVALILPQNRRKKQALALRRQVEVGSRVMLTSGLYGTITEIDDDTIVIEASEGVEMRYAKAAVLRVIPEELESDADTDTDTDTSTDADTDADTRGTDGTEADGAGGTIDEADADPDQVARPSNRQGKRNGNGETPGSVPAS